MCGICGQYNYLSNEPVDKRNIKKMTTTLVHRGPDDEGFYYSGNLGLGFRRLSIIDLNKGHQPMSNPERKIWVVLNGEIYNFLELRKELKSYGYVFATDSDTEVVIHGYKHWGVDILNHLNGMFGLGIWDEHKKRLILARDAMGVKPVYYINQGGRLYFASEIRAIVAATGEKTQVDLTALNLFLRYRYTPAPLTLFKGIKKLAAGTMLIVEDGGIHLQRWYTYSPVPFSPVPGPNEAGEELLALYKRAVKRQLISDVPVGILLSGGIDSGLLLALMNLEGNSWPAFTVGYGDSFKDDEVSDAAETARILSARHAIVYLDRSVFEQTLPNIMTYLEEPVATSSIVPMFSVCARARQDVKVALIGQGPDELFGGYKRHLGVKYGAYWRNLPTPLRRLFSLAISALPRNESLKRGIYSLSTPNRMKRYQQVFSILPGDNIDSLFHDDALETDAGDRVLQFWHDLGILSEHTDELGGLQFLEIRSSLPDELLMFGDKLSMAHSLEVRVPYLDREVVEYVEKLGASFKIRHGSTKWLHRRVCREFLPEEVISRKKRGFASNVVDDWFRESMSGMVAKYLLDRASLMFRYLKAVKVENLCRDHMSGKSDHHKILFSLIAFEVWLRCNT